MPRAKFRDGVFEREDTPGWYVSYVDAAGVRRKKRVVASTRTQALQALSAIKAKVQTELLTGIKPTSDISTAELFARFKRYQKARLKPTTFERMGGVLEALERALPAQAKAITKRSVAEYIEARYGSVKPATIVKEIATLKHCLSMAVEWQMLQSNPATGAKLPRIAEGRTRYLSPTELKAVLEAAPEWMRAPIALAAFTGMRRGELLSLRWQDVDLDGSRAYLHETKNGRLRVLALNELAIQVLSSLPRSAPSDLVLAGVDGMRLSVYTRRIFAALKIEGASFHTLRHTAASWLTMQGVDLYAVGQMLGHRTPRMTQRYAHLSPSYMAAAAGKLEGVFSNVLPSPKPGTPTGLTERQTDAKGSEAKRGTSFP